MTPVQEWVQQTLHDNLVYSRDGGFRTIGVGDSHMNDGSLRYQGLGESAPSFRAEVNRQV